MKKTLKGMIVMVIAIMVMGIVNVSNAFSFNANLSSKDKLVAGQKVKVTLSLSSIDMDEGIRSIKVGKITLGEEFEAVSSTNFTSNTWMPTYSKGGLILMSGTPIKDAGVAVTLTLKVKQGITAKSATIKFENIVASSGSNTGDISVGTKNITIKADETVEGGNKTEIVTGISTPTKPNTQDELNKTGENSKNNTTENTTSSKKLPATLPKAGDTKGIVIISLILISIVAGGVSFIRYKKCIRK